MKTETSATGTTTFVYSALGQMIEASGPRGTNLNVYDQGGHLFGEYDGAGNLLQETVWLGDIPVATIQLGGSSITIYYVETDQLDTPREVIRPIDNALMWNWFTGPFGIEAPNTNPQGAGAFTYDLRFPGQIAGAWGNPYQNWFRDYDPAVGRYLESDPLGLSGGINTYAYGRENPVMRIDPLGLCDIKLRCGGVKRWGLTLGWHCGVIAPNGGEYGLGGGSGSSGSTGTAQHYYEPPGAPKPGQKEFPVSCACKSCSDVQKCIQQYYDTRTPPPYSAIGPNSDTYAHRMISSCGCSASSVPWNAWAWDYGFSNYGNTDPFVQQYGF